MATHKLVFAALSRTDRVGDSSTTFQMQILVFLLIKCLNLIELCSVGFKEGKLVRTLNWIRVKRLSK